MILYIKRESINYKDVLFVSQDRQHWLTGIDDVFIKDLLSDIDNILTGKQDEDLLAGNIYKVELKYIISTKLDEPIPEDPIHDYHSQESYR